MKRTKLFIFAAALSMLTSAFADEFDDFGLEGYEESTEPTVEIGGMVEMNSRAYVDHKAGGRDDSENLEWNDVGGRTVAVFPTGRVNIGFSNTFSDVELKLKLDKTSLNGYYQDILDEFTARAYIGNFQFEAGKMRLVWGKGDKLHVLDNFNANDYTDYIIPDYIDRRIAEPMFHAVYSTNNNVKFEAVYTPFMTADRLASTGVWVPKQSRELTELVSKKAKDFVKEKKTAALEANNTAAKISALANDLQTAGAAYQAAATAYQTAATAYQTAAAIVQQKGASATDAEKLAMTNAKTEFDQLKGAFDASKAAYDSANAALTSVVTENAVLLAGYGLNLADTTGTLGAAVLKYVTDANTNDLYALNNASSFSNNPDSIYPDLYQLKYGQFGFRTTFTLGSVDLGLSYYNGRNKQPSVNYRKIDSYLNKVLSDKGDGKTKITDEDRFVDYDRLQVFGFEAATVLFGRLNSRMEFAYNMTEDFAGDDPAIHNNSLGWVAGFDIDLPIHNVNFNVQTQGKYILKGDEINALKAFDVDADANDCYTNNKLIVDITDSWAHEKIKLDLKGIWGIERGDVLVMPTLTFMLKDDFALNLSGLYIWCKDSDSEFDGWEHNSYAQIGIKYQF